MNYCREAKLALTCCILAVTAGQHPDTKFTKVPTSPISADVGSDVEFYWRFSFAVGSEDRSRFEEIIWGSTDEKRNMIDKYITVYGDLKTFVNTQQLPESLNKRLSVTGNITQTETNLVFVIKDVTLSDADRAYGCRAIVWGEWIESGPIQLVVKGPPQMSDTGHKVSVPPSITIRTNELKVRIGEDVELECDASGEPQPWVKWSKEGVVKQSSKENTTLIIDNFKPEDAGRYVCNATNTGGSVAYRVTVSVAT